MDTAKKAVDTTIAAGMGQTPVELSHPIHPSTVHFPIAMLSGAFALDALQQFAPSIFQQASSAGPAGLLSRIIPPAHIVPSLSHFMNAAGIATASISIATGVTELLGMLKGQAAQKGGYYNAIKDAYTGSSEDLQAIKLKTTITHASMNDFVVGVAVYNFYKRATNANLALPKFNAYLSTAMLPLFFYSAYLGGALVYEYGVGVFRQGEAPKMKELQEKSS